MSERTALEIADEHDAYDDVPQAKEVAAMLRSQDAEIYRLRRERRHIYDLLARIHRNSMERGSATPDFILAEYMSDCLLAFDKAVSQRTAFYGQETKGSVSVSKDEQ